MTDPDGVWGASDHMTAWESVMWRGERNLHTRASGVLLELLDSEPDWERFRTAHARAVQAFPRLRDKVVEPLLPVVNPAWVPDEHFDLDYHVQRVRLPEPGTQRQLLDLAAHLASRPLDQNRPCWEALLVGGLEGGRAAYLLKVHHALSDGLGLMQLLEMAHSRTAEPGHYDTIPVPNPEGGRKATPLSLVTETVTRDVLGAPVQLARRTGDLLGLVGRTLRDPVRSVTSVVDYGQSLRRVLAPPSVPRSPLLRGKGVGYRLVMHDVPLADLKAAAKVAGGSVNDAYLASVLGVFRRFHAHHGVHVDWLPMAIPVSLRTADDPKGGNKFAGARLAGPVGEPDPVARVRLIRERIDAARREPAIGVLDVIAPVMSRLPTAALNEVGSSMTDVSDLQASNVPGLRWPVYLAGARVLRFYPIGPRPGVAAMVTMVSYDGTCCIGVNIDPDVAPDIEAFERFLVEGFDEVLALAR